MKRLKTAYEKIIFPTVDFSFTKYCHASSKNRAGFLSYEPALLWNCKWCSLFFSSVTTVICLIVLSLLGIVLSLLGVCVVGRWVPGWGRYSPGCCKTGAVLGKTVSVPIAQWQKSLRNRFTLPTDPSSRHVKCVCMHARALNFFFFFLFYCSFSFIVSYVMFFIFPCFVFVLFIVLMLL